MHMCNEKALADTVEEFNRAAGTEWNLTFQSTEWYLNDDVWWPNSDGKGGL